MTIQLIIDGVQVPVKHIRFSDGSSNVKLEIPDSIISKKLDYYSIAVEPTTMMDNTLWEILQVTDALERIIILPERRYLFLDYLPHGRADRVFEKGNCFPLELFMQVITSYCNFTNIVVVDPHNERVLKSYGHWLDVAIINQDECFVEIVTDIQSGDVLVSPDKGAVPKIEQLHRRLHGRDIATFLVKADKKRDVATGRIIETVLPEDANINGKRCIIVDDILDAGGTFIPLAQKLKEAGASSVELYVTHGIFAKGLDIFKGVIDKIHVYGTVGTYVNQKDIINFNNGKEVKCESITEICDREIKINSTEILKEGSDYKSIVRCTLQKVISNIESQGFKVTSI